MHVYVSRLWQITNYRQLSQLDMFYSEHLVLYLAFLLRPRHSFCRHYY